MLGFVPAHNAVEGTGAKSPSELPERLAGYLTLHSSHASPYRATSPLSCHFSLSEGSEIKARPLIKVVGVRDRDHLAFSASWIATWTR
jgi:hypothetical protein